MLVLSCSRTVTFVALLLSFLVWLYLRWRYSPSHCPYAKVLEDIQLLLDPPHSTERETLTQRADSNKRLIRAFGLTNTFVSGEPEVHRHFVRHARRLLIGAQKNGWKAFRDLSFRAVRAALSSPGHGGEVQYDAFIQSVTLRVVLVGLLGVDREIEVLDEEDIRIVADHITRLWSLSKTGDQIPDKHLFELNVCLRRLVPDEDAFPNPLDLVVPAWETLWRVIALAIAHTHTNAEVRDAFREFVQCPDEQAFRSTSRGGISVRGVIAETMRLHPPSKHIGRVITRPWVSRILPIKVLRLVKNTPLQRLAYQTARADIGSIQRNSSLWGPEAGSLDPTRHQALTPNQEYAIQLVFGYGPHRCIAASWAPVAAGVIASTVLECLDGRKWCIMEGPIVGGRDGWDGWRVRRSSNLAITIDN